ncbi:MAG TPA: site-specific DNA-methyltransferase [Anaerolineae bacterium]|nr:site-specific DNA-methyltransferase [Anaerolineae bacterium]
MTRNGSKPSPHVFSLNGVTLHCADVMTLYELWQSPVVIVSDGPYGVGGFDGDPPTPEGLANWYEPHIRAWSAKATPLTTLWFWNTEIGWANVHPVLVKHGWTYRNCHVWDKGIAHIAGNANTQSLRKFPVVTEVCVQYVKEATFEIDGRQLTMQEWLRAEWERSKLPLYKTNEASGVKNAATRKYFTKDHLWYYPPVEAFEGLVRYANVHGDPSGRPYFSLDRQRSLTGAEWERMRAKFYCEVGVTNVWREPAVRGSERLKAEYKCVHTNQKPLKLLEVIIRASSDEGDLVWEPFGGLCSVGVAARNLKRRCLSAEIRQDFYEIAIERFRPAPVEPTYTKLRANGSQGTQLKQGIANGK